MVTVWRKRKYIFLSKKINLLKQIKQFIGVGKEEKHSVLLKSMTTTKILTFAFFYFPFLYLTFHWEFSNP